MASRPTPPTNLTPANRFRPIIEEAIVAGVDLSHQVLQLTHGDTAKLKRDPTVRDDEISFRNGTMEFIGVRVIQGAATSGLADVNGIVVTPSPSEKEVSAMAKGQKKSNKEVRKPKAEKAKPVPAGKDFTVPPTKAR